MNDLKELLQEAKDAVGPGWWPIIDKYLPQMSEIAPEGEYYFKEKYGTLRMNVYSKGLDRETLNQFEVAAENESMTVCEECGAPGKLRNKLCWIQTLCRSCYRKAKHNKE